MVVVMISCGRLKCETGSVLLAKHHIAQEEEALLIQATPWGGAKYIGGISQY